MGKYRVVVEPVPPPHDSRRWYWEVEPVKPMLYQSSARGWARTRRGAIRQACRYIKQLKKKIEYELDTEEIAK